MKTKTTAHMDKKVISLMCENIKNIGIDLDHLAVDDQEETIDFIHNQYRIAENQIKNLSRSAPRI